jgi:NADH dehydrogenase (ubiquinone) Fe-S protein 3
LNLNNLVLILINFRLLPQNSLISVFKKTYKNHIYIYIYNNIKKITFILKNSLNFFFLSLIEVTGLDISMINNYNYLFNLDNINKYFEKIIIYNFIDYKTNFRYIFNLFVNKFTKIYSIEKFFLNANWLERELIEFFNIQVFLKNDTRNLLLDYNLMINPLLKNFPTEGYQELYFNFNTYTLDYINSDFVEL